MAIDNLMVSHGTRNAIDVWILNTDDEIKKRTKKRLKKLKRERDAAAIKKGSRQKTCSPCQDMPFAC